MHYTEYARRGLGRRREAGRRRFVRLLRVGIAQGLEKVTLLRAPWAVAPARPCARLQVGCAAAACELAGAAWAGRARSRRASTLAVCRLRCGTKRTNARPRKQRRHSHTAPQPQAAPTVTTRPHRERSAVRKMRPGGGRHPTPHTLKTPQTEPGAARSPLSAVADAALLAVDHDRAAVGHAARVDQPRVVDHQVGPLGPVVATLDRAPDAAVHAHLRRRVVFGVCERNGWV